MSLPYFKEFNWQAEVVAVDERYSDLVKDELLLESLPIEVKIHKVKALEKKWTSKVGLGSLALRSMWYYRKKVNSLLKARKFDLIYFSTTEFPVCILGAYWKRKFGVPYIIDMQDPWHSDYYQDKPKHQRPAKYWFSYRLNKYLEPIAIKSVDGLISVSESYLKTLNNRYPILKNIPQATVTFGAYEKDLKIALDNSHRFAPLLDSAFKNIVYVGRGGADMRKALEMLFEALKQKTLENAELVNKLKFYFIGTSYAPKGLGQASILPIAYQYGLQNNVIEVTDRISYYHTLLTLKQADALFIPGSDDPGYTASKIYPYLLTAKPLLAIFNRQSSVVPILKKCTIHATILTLPDDEEGADNAILRSLVTNWANNDFKNIEVTSEFENYSARTLTQKQIELFNKVNMNHTEDNFTAI
ncbi:hypothetical protein D0C36_08840 [Mucilaginibacter conchicola]|uniref:Glycosyltransferase subfamily 4-like N-terminal domain-containing protein n=2 Tax=Mucilaginibacter conchicola TaxID=2303333 RepID=A0A372P178_9SPHI|nr:hypothetical protein D0C36_08840 [Mucilaginibacter conchicola]